jgi:hypothetical protein
MTAQIVAIIAALASLFLVLRGYRSHGVSSSDTMKMALAWTAIILVVAGVVSLVAR